MKDEKKTKKELVKELASLRRKIAKFERAGKDAFKRGTPPKSSEYQLYKVFEDSLDMIFRLNLKTGQYEYVSPSVKHLTGFTPSEFINMGPKGVIERLHTDDRQRFMDNYISFVSKAENEDKIFHNEYRMKRKDGQWLWLSANHKLILGRAGKAEALIGSIRDISESKKALEVIMQSEQFSNSLLHNAPYPVLVINPDTSVRYVSPAFERLTGFSYAEVVGIRVPYPWWTTDTLEKTGKDLARAMKEGAVKLEELFQKKTGEKFWVEISFSIIHSGDKISYYITNWVDITERKKIEARERRNMLDMEFLSETAMDFVEISPDENIYNLIAEKLLKITEDSIVMVNSFDRETGKLKCEAIKAPGGNTSYLAEALEKDIPGMIFAVNKEGIESLLKSTLDILPGGLYDLFYGQIGPDICEKIEGDLEINQCNAIGFTQKGDLLGSTSIITRSKDKTLKKNVIEAFIRQASVALYKRKAEEATRKSERKYRQLYDSSLDGILACDMNKRLTECNAVFEKMIGYSMDELHGMTYEDITPKKYHNWQQRFFERTMLVNGHSGIYDKEYIRKDGTIFPVEISAFLTRDADGKPSGMWAIIRDISERKAAEQALLTSEEKYRLLVESQTDLVVKVDTEARLTFVSPSYCRLFGMEESELLGKKFTPLIRKNDKDKTIKAMENLHKPPYTCYVEQRAKTIYGWRWIGWMNTALLDESKNIKAIIGVGRDVTERRREEEAVINAASQWRKTFDIIPDLIMTIDPEFRITRVNKTMSEALGLSFQEILGRQCFRLVCNSERPPEYCPHTKIWRDKMECSFELRMEKFNGDFAVSSTPILDNKGNLVGTVHVFRNITDSKVAERELLNYQEQLRWLTSELTLAEDRERRRLATHLHDDVGQMLAISKMKLGELKKNAPSEKLASSLAEVKGYIDDAIQQTRNLIFDLSPPILHDLGLEAAIEWLAGRFLEKHGLEYSFENEDTDKPIDNDVQVTLFHAVRELMMNVVKHSAAKKTDISVKRNGEFIQIHIEDDGRGFDSNEKVEYRGGSEGFGLFNIRERLDRLGGRLDIISAEGRGTTCILTAPLSKTRRGREGAIL